jgi:hypothetical protein
MSTVNEIAREQTAEKDVGGYKLSRVWLVQLDSHLWGPYSAIEAVTADPNGADIGDAHPLSPFIFLQRFGNPSVEENRKVWRVTGEYDQSGTPSWPGNPLQAPAQIAWSSATHTEPIVQDVNGDAVVNSAGQQFDPPLTQERRVLVATITYNIEQWSAATAATYQGTVNIAATVIGNVNVAARMAKIIEINGTQQYYNDTPYWTVVTKVEITTEVWATGQGWDRQVLDQGLYGLDADDKFGILVTEKGEDASEPLLLDGAGHALDPQTAAPHFLTFRVNRETNFAPLNLEVN